MTQVDVLVVGGGISGLSVAWWLARRGIRAELWERGQRPGGKILSTREAGYLSERAAGLIVNFRPQVDQLLAEAGLSDVRRDLQADRKRYLVYRGALTEVPMHFGRMAASPLWSWRCKLRMAAELLVPRGGHERETVSEFVSRRLGREILELAMEPFVAGTLASDPDLANAQSLLPRLTALEQRYGSLGMGMLINRLLKRRRANAAESFAFAGGLSRLVTALAAEPGLRLRAHHGAVEIAPLPGHGWRVTADTPHGSERRLSKHLILSTPAADAARLLAPLDTDCARLLAGIEYAPLAVVHLGLARAAVRHPLDGTGFLVPRRERLNCNGNLWMGSLFPERAPKGKTLLTSYLGGARHPRRADWSDERLATAVVDDLGPLLHLDASPEYLRVDRHSRALPLYHGPYLERVRDIRRQLERLPGLHLLGNYMDGVSVRDRIFQGWRSARLIAAELDATGSGRRLSLQPREIVSAG